MNLHDLHKVLERQFNLNHDKNLLFARIAHAMELDPLFLAALERLLFSPHMQKSTTLSDELLTTAVNEMIEKLYSINQYLQVDEESRAALKAIYIRTWDLLIHTKDIGLTLRKYHYPELRDWAEKLYPPSMAKTLRRHFKIGRVPNAEYSAETQIRILGLDTSSVRQPVLDVGCGKHGNLVQFLRLNGIDAHGIDRAISIRDKCLEEVDWLSYSFGSGMWGTIIANLSFSSHYAYVRRYDPDQTGTYSQKYAEILESLKPGGLFVYAPGAAELECQIDLGKYHIERTKLISGYEAVQVIRGDAQHVSSSSSP
jgi:hypothetical protein